MHKGGRPTQLQQVDLEKKFHECYLRGFDALNASKKVGTDKKTAYRYYNKITSEIIQEHNKEYFARVQQSLEQTIQSFDYLLDYYYEILDQTNEQLSKNDEFFPQLNYTKIAILKEIKNILKDKASIRTNTPRNPTFGFYTS